MCQTNPAPNSTPMADSKTKAMGILCVLLLVSTLWVPAVWASGTSYPSAATAPTEDPMLVTKTLKCLLLEVNDQGALKIQNTKTEEVGWIRLGEDTELRAKNKKAFDGRKQLDVSDLKAGQWLRVTHRPHDGAILKIKVLKDS